jgi:hypothetical protein
LLGNEIDILDGITVSEAGLSAASIGSAFRIYAEASGDFDHAAIRSMQTGIAVSNVSNSPAMVKLELYGLDGSSTGLMGTLIVPANGQVVRFLNQIQELAQLPLPFHGVLRVSSSSPASVVGLRVRYNERNDFLITAVPTVNEAAAPGNAEFVFPHFADAGGYTTQFILFSGSAGQKSSGVLRLISQSGQALNLALH